jgi:hypothetical protein
MFRKSLPDRMIRRRFVVTLKGGEGSFGGVLTESDRNIMVFEDCRTVPTHSGGTPDPIAGRVFVERSSIAYVQDVS